MKTNGKQAAAIYAARIKAKPKKYRVWVDQVNRTILDVVATDPKNAKDKAYRKWRRGYAFPTIGQVEEDRGQ